MALTANYAEELDEGMKLRHSKEIEWVKVTNAAADTNAATVVYSYKKIKSCQGVLCAGPFEALINNTNKTVTFRLIGTANVANQVFIGLVAS